MKKLYTAAIALIALLGVAGCSQNAAKENTGVVTSVVKEEQPVVKDTSMGASAAKSEETLTLNNMLKYAIEDEYLASTEYESIMDKFGETQPYINISTAEKKHIEFLTPLFEKYNIQIPDNKAKDFVALPETLEKTYQTNVDAEIANIAMYDRFLQQDLPEDVRDVFVKLRDASKNHLQAFQNRLEGNAYQQGKGKGGGLGEGKMQGQGHAPGQGQGHGPGQAQDQGQGKGKQHVENQG